MNFSRQERLVFILLSTVMIISIGFFLYKNWLLSRTKDVFVSATPMPIIIQIAGEVVRPGVYEVEDGTRLYQLIDLAGGATTNADLSGFNLAAPILDGMRITIPSQHKSRDGFVESSPIPFMERNLFLNKTAEQKASSSSVNINTASLEELQSLPGIGEVIAKRIIEFRQTSGPFRSIDDLLGVKGIGNKKLQDIKDLITF